MKFSHIRKLPVETSWRLWDEGCSSLRPRFAAARFRWFWDAFLIIRVIRDVCFLARASYYDFTQFITYSSAVFTGNSREKLSALITMAYHGIEKGLSLPAPRPGFGKDLVCMLTCRLERYGAAFGFDENAVIALNVLRRYCGFNEANGTLDLTLKSRIEALSRYASSRSPSTCQGGVKLILRQDFLKHAKMDLREFFGSRSSVRQYSDQFIDMEDIVAAISLAQKTPSCCNRQSGRVWVMRDQMKVQKALKIQGGARGFSQEVPAVLVVTSDLACFQSDGERFQAWIDGGMFAMSLVYALHSLGLVSCCLNWSKGHATDKQFKREFQIPGNETIIMLISVGHPKNEFAVAQSYRCPVTQIMRVV